ncbi:MAG: hypothetical protein QM708_11285 [Propioniciclava sp.]|uniref:hypothetical protein n=1 Tax=Propioniciclava sp. TaxID=2038686 RepID=UPI0039E48B5C
MLDAQGLSGWLVEDRRILALLRAAHRREADVVVSAMTILEVTHRRLDRRRLDWVLSRVRIEPVTDRSARAASALLVAAGLHGHAHAIDAVVAELASRQVRPVALMTSDPGDLSRLCEGHVKVVGV